MKDRIVIIVSGSVVGGHEMQLAQILHDLSDIYPSVSLICSSREIADFFDKLGFSAIFRPFFVKGKIWRQWMEAPRIAVQLKNLIGIGDDILVSGGSIEACVGPARAVKIIYPGSAIAAYIPMYIDRSKQIRIIGTVYNFLVDRIGHIVDRYLTINRIQALKIAHAFRRPTFYVPNVISRGEFPKRTFGKRLIYIGRLDDHQKALVEMLGFLDSEANPYDSILIIGDGPDRDRLQAEANGLSRLKVEFAGWKTKSEMDEMLGADDCLILNSRWEGEPLVVREFAARGLPCVARGIDGVRGVVPRKNRYSNQQEMMQVLNRVFVAASTPDEYMKLPREIDRAATLRRVFA